MFLSLCTEISQLWSKYDNWEFFIHYHHADTHDSVCDNIDDFSHEEKSVKHLECYEGWTDVGVFIYFGNVSVVDDCSQCIPPAKDEEDSVAYYFEVRKLLLFDSFVPICFEFICLLLLCYLE